MQTCYYNVMYNIKQNTTQICCTKNFSTKNTLKTNKKKQCSSLIYIKTYSVKNLVIEKIYLYEL